ncbi:MAG: glycosyl transferase [Paracoccaceae bacterium]|nr:glycosyl transferase [Paracoccaceae bacterium]
MARIAYILLVHKDPEGIVAQAERLTAAGDVVAIHMDARASAAAFDHVRKALADNPGVTFARRVKCGWGEWSLVQATLNGLHAALEAFPRATHFYLLSGDCMPIKSAAYAHGFLDAEDADYIESFDFFTSGWIKTGMREERLIYRHLVNERRHKWLFYKMIDLQRRLHLQRRIPADLDMRIGSQWWCLRRRTVEAILDFLKARRDVRRFFRTTWIPDETVFQTLVHHLVPSTQIRRRTLTFLIFTDYGMPVNFYNDHYDMLLGQNYLFARKISPDATDLKARLGSLYSDDQATFTISDEGRQVFQFLTGRGREGRRIAPRFWETGSSIGRGREVMLLVCRDWTAGQRLAARLRQAAGVMALGYVFNDAAAEVPDLGGIQTTLEKRCRHRRAVMRLLFEACGTDRLILCVDPSSFGLLKDFTSDRCTARVLEVQADLSDAFLTGHAGRTGLTRAETPPDVIARLLPTLRQEMRYESDRLAEAGFPGFRRLREGASTEENAEALATFLAIPPDQAKAIAAEPDLFAQ